MAKGARVVRKSSATRSKIRCHVGRPWADQCRDERRCKRTEVLRESSKTGAEGPVRADSEGSVTKAAEERGGMRKAPLLICADLWLFCASRVAQDKARGETLEPEVPKVLATDD